MSWVATGMIRIRWTSVLLEAEGLYGVLSILSGQVKLQRVAGGCGWFMAPDSSFPVTVYHGITV
jgi:hypothetical protein